MVRRSTQILLLILPVWAATGSAQIRSSTASVTLLAHIQESFSIQPVAIPAGQSFNRRVESMPQALQVWLGWTLQQGRDFQIKYKLEGQNDSDSPASDSGLVSLKQRGLMPLVFSFMPFETYGSPVVGVWGNNEEDPMGEATFMLALPKPEKGEALRVRISVVIL